MENLTKNIVAFRKGFVTANDCSLDNRIAVSTFQANIMAYGYILSENAFELLSKTNIQTIEILNNELLAYLKRIFGGSKEYKPLYKNFPSEVMSLSDNELFLNAIKHYWSYGEWEPSTVEMERPVSFEKIKYNVLEFITENDFTNIFTTLVSINSSLTPNDMEIVNWFVSSGEKLLFPKTIPFKENLCTLASLGLDVPIKTTTDVLRICVHMSGGDISLPKVPSKLIKRRWGKSIPNPFRESFMFKKFSRKERKYILSLLEKTNCDPKEMVLKYNRWIRLGEILHPGEFKNLFPRSFSAFNELRNTKVKSWYSGFNEEMAKGLEYGLSYISKRPGEFSRKLDWFIRNYTKPNELDLILTYFSKSVKETSNKVLFEVYTHFENRLHDKERRIMVKGARKSTKLTSLPSLKKNVVETIHRKLFETLKEKFSLLPELGNCWVDEELKKIPLPTNMRSLSPTAIPLIRGQRVPLGNPDASVIRAFVHWMGPVDLDLSAGFFKKDGYNSRVDFTNLALNSTIHSGDVRGRRGPCAEYIDISIEELINNEYRYVTIDVRNFDDGGLEKVNAVFGFMERQYPESNNLWLPSTINNTFSLKSKDNATIVCLIDLSTKEYILLDIDSNSITLSGDRKTVIDAIEEFTELPKVSVYDLVMMHVEARGRLVTLDSSVDTFFKYDDFMSSYEKTVSLMGI